MKENFNVLILRAALLLSIALPLCLTLPAQNRYRATSLEELKTALEKAQPGDEIVLTKELNIDAPFTISASGTAEKPVVIRAEETGTPLVAAEIQLQGDHLTLSGMKFTGENGQIVINGRGCRLSRCIFSDSKANKWVRVLPGAAQIEIDHNLFEHKTSNLTGKNCQLLQVIVRNENERHHIHHNLFRDIPPGDGNGYETVQLITEGNPFDPPGGRCNTVIENNLFIRCNGEAEIISVKSNGNSIRNNTFRACRGGLVLRHGDDNAVTGNFFFGDGEAESGGVRLQGTGQMVMHNYFQDLGQYGISMMDGTPDDLYIRVERAEISSNTLINCRRDLVIGLNHSKHPNGTPPKDCRIIGNVFYDRPGPSTGTAIEFIQGDEPVDWTWSDNIAYGNGERPDLQGVRDADPRLRFRQGKIALPTRRTPKAPSLAIVVEHAQTGLLRKDVVITPTVGAIQYPVKDRIEPLTEEMAGPDSK